MKASIIETDRLILKPLNTNHLTQRYVDWLNDNEVNQYMASGGDYTLEKLKNYLLDVEKKDIYFWAIHIKEIGLHIGNIKIDPIYTENRRAEYGIMMGEKSQWNKGYAKEASLAVINYCFKKLNLLKITLGVIAENKNAVKLYHKLGFEIEGHFKKHTYYNNKFYDVYRMAIFNKNALQ